MQSRTIFIWDVHWCYDELKLLLKKLKIKEEDRVFFTWDLINKWPKSYKVIKLLYKNKDQYKVVLWNHELWFLNWIEWKAPQYECKIYRKLKKKLLEYPEKLDYIKNLPLYIEGENFLLIHWGLIPEKKLEDHKAEEICNIRTYKGKPWHDYYNGDKKVIYWHWAVAWLHIKEKTIWLDTWCCYWNRLTAYILETWEVVTQEALKQYIDPFKKNSIIYRIRNYLKKKLWKSLK